jgi:hypothetical protein
VYKLARALGFTEDAERQQASAGGIEGNVSMVMDLIAEYPEHLHYLGTVKNDGEKTKVVLSACPFVDRRHEGGNSAFLVYDSGAVRYKCFAEGCPGEGFGSLLRLLSNRTGRASQAFRLDGSLTERDLAYLELWGFDEPETCIIAATPETPAPTVETSSTETETTTMSITEPTAEAELLGLLPILRAQDPRSVPEIIKSIDWTKLNVTTDPAKWGLTLDDIRETYRRRVLKDMDQAASSADREEIRLRWARATEARDTREMGRHLGKYWLATIAANKQTRPSIPSDAVISAADLMAYIND